MHALIPGSEVFNSRPLPRDELRRRIHPDLKLHSVGQDAIEALDPLTYEVIRHRLWAITEEMGSTLKRMSGSHAVTEANDFCFSICDELGDPVQVGLYNSGMIGSIDLAIFWTLEHRSENPGIFEGDMFLCNDPWIGGGLHQNDAAVLAPIFVDGQLFGWSTAICHQLDLGGVSPGSWGPTAADVFAESVPTPPIKVVRGGVLQRDVADVWVRRSRVPLLVGLDLRAKVGANNAAVSRIGALVSKYGADIVKAVMKRIMDDAELRLRERIRGLPDGQWKATGYQEQATQGDRTVYPIALTLTKSDDRLIFDFTGTAKQAGMINCPYPGLRAGIAFQILPLLAYDITWSSGGLFRVIDIVTEEGTINNAQFPAAVGKGPVGPAWATGNVVAECMARMLGTTAETRQQVQSVCAGTFDLCALAGLDERTDQPHPFVSAVFDTMAGGFGAQIEQDGVDTGGFQLIPQGRAPDVEMTEFLYPLLYLWRREECDSGGPGRTRGGMSGSVCMIPYRTTQPFSLVFSGAGKAASQNIGLAGGYPGNTQLDVIVRGSDAAALLAAGVIPAAIEDMAGQAEVQQCEAVTLLAPEDALFLHWQSGGGYGDPLLRDPALVADDVAADRVSRAVAQSIYGVELDGDAVDVARTDTLRAQMRARRLDRAGKQPPLERASDASMANPITQIDPSMLVVSVGGDAKVACACCGTLITDFGQNPYENLAVVEGAPSEAGPQIFADSAAYVDAEILFRQLCCPGCGSAMLTSVAPASHPLPQPGGQFGSCSHGH